MRLLREIHGVLLSGGRGAGKLPGEFRRSQNWIGGSRPGNARFVPPSPDELMECLGAFEKFLHEEQSTLPVLIQIGLAHVQFETIHPFLDGNGRLGRLLITLLLCEKGIMSDPILYLSLYFKENRNVYYDLLQQVRQQGDWEVWLEFFLEGVFKTAKQALLTIQEINAVFTADLAAIEMLGRAKFSCIEVLEYMKKLPQVSVKHLSRELGITPPTARNALHQMLKLGIVKEVSEKKRDKIYVYTQYLEILERDAKPL